MNKVQEVLSSAFVYSNEENFDDDFRQILQLFYFFGWFRPIPSSTRKVCGFLVIVLVYLTFLLGALRDVVAAFYQGRMQQSLISVAAAGILVSLTIQTFTFTTNQAFIMRMIKMFHTIHKGEDETPLNAYRKTCSRVAKTYRTYLQVLWVFVIGLYFCGFKVFKLSLPCLYDVYAEGKFFAPLLVMSFLQGFIVYTVISGSDTFHVLCMVRIGANFEILCNKVQHCTDSKDLQENERNLISCIKYHRQIREETFTYRRVYAYFYASIVAGTIVNLVCFFFSMMKSSVISEPMDFVLGFVGLGMSIFQISSLCLVGQWLTTKSADLLEVSFYCNWPEQSSSFKKAFMIFRTVCQKEVAIGVLKFNFTNALLNEMVSNAYFYYRSMSETMETIGKKSKTV